MATVVTLLVVGLSLLALEVVLPGLIAGIAGLICTAAAVVFAYREFGLAGGNITLVLAMGTLVCGFFVWLRFFPGSHLGRRFVSKGQVGELGGEQLGLLHQTGTAVTNLRPSGTALINGRRIDVVTEGPMVLRGSPVRVVAVEGMRVIVRTVDNPNPPYPESRPS